MRTVLLTLLIGAAAAAAAPAWAADSQGAPLAPGGEVFAVVGEVVLRGEEYERAFQQAARQKFYHRKPPRGEVDALRREVGDGLIHRVLLLDEARRRGLEPDRAQIDKTVAAYEARYAHSAQWQQRRDTLLPGLRRHLEEKDLLERLERGVRNGPAASEAQAKAYYDAHREQFTEPAKAKLSAILLKVDPSSPQLAWDRAREQAEQIVERLRAGADFAEMARLHSGDSSAANGGDLGYLHRGMLQESMQKVVDDLEPGTVSAPVLVLEGVAIVRLERREPAKLRTFADVKARAASLWERERADRKWAGFLSRLRGAATIRVDASRYPSPDARRGGSGEKGA